MGRERERERHTHTHTHTERQREAAMRVGCLLLVVVLVALLSPPQYVTALHEEEARLHSWCAAFLCVCVGVGTWMPAFLAHSL